MPADLTTNLLPVADEEVRAQRKLIGELAGLRWERMSPSFALPWSGEPARHGDLLVPPGPAHSVVREGRSRFGTRRFSLRTLDLDFTLIGRERLRRGGVGTALYSIGYALHDGRMRPGVLLGEAWWRTRDADPEAVLAVLRRAYAEVDHRTEQASAALVRFRVAAVGAPDAR